MPPNISEESESPIISISSGSIFWLEEAFRRSIQVSKNCFEGFEKPISSEMKRWEK